MPDRWNRREVLSAGIFTGAAIALKPIARAEESRSTLRLEDRMTPYPATWYRPYVSRPAASASSSAWVQIDLGSALKVEALRIYPNFDDARKSIGFPSRMKIEGADDPTFASPKLLFDSGSSELPEPGDHIAFLPVLNGSPVRYVRLTGASLRPIKKAEGETAASYGLSFAKVEVIAAGRDAAEGRAVTADPATENAKDLAQLTRKPRPVGEGIVTDNPQNVTDPQSWHRVANRAEVPRRGVELGEGVLRDAMQKNIEYLLTSYSVDEMLRPFRERAGKPVPAGLRPPIPFWDTDLPGSSAGRFLMGAANTLRWQQHEELQQRMNAIVDGIADCRQPDGYIMAYPEDSIMHSERAGYTRAWVTHGLLEAGYTGHPKAFELLRGYYDWFDRCPYLPKLLRGTAQGVQGMVANTRMYLSPVGRPEDLAVVQRYFQENYWLKGLARRDETMVWQYPYDRPHNYLLTDIEAYFDLYRATGAPLYKEAVEGAWQLYRDNWEHVGGSIAITEFGEFPPKSYRLKAQFDFCETGELCGSSFWAFLNQRFQLLDPDNETYATEIEKSIYNVGIASQFNGKGFFYHARLVGKKGDKAVGYCTNSCCEGQGTRLAGSIPEHLYSIVPTGSDPGLYIHMFASSTIRWTQRDSQENEELKLSMKTIFPHDSNVQLDIDVSSPRRSVIRVRTPSWATAEMPIRVNGEVAGTGKPGSYVLLDRTWKSGDSISFTLPMGFRLTRYTGMDKIAGSERYALEYGPILLAVANSDEARLNVSGTSVDSFKKQLKAIPDQPLCFNIEGNPDHRYEPYYALKEETFTCFPVIESAVSG
ncbi:MAG: glycoside hydrolase family 127 protein [Acidobacteria bacterium]|nr:glycoside hydrolase family 127 protein [Acidobacteriota bacterium]